MTPAAESDARLASSRPHAVAAVRSSAPRAVDTRTARSVACDIIGSPVDGSSIPGPSARRMPLIGSGREGRPSDRETTVMRIVSAALLLTSVFADRGRAQAHYYNLDGGRPTRVEDAVPTERGGVDLHLAALRLERLDDATYRWRSEPKVSFGMLPMTSFELRAPITHLVRSGARGRGTTALAGIGVGAQRGLNVERARLPALALAGEALVPVGGFSSGRTSYAVQMLATKTTPIVRTHLNASLGTYGVRAPRQIAATGPVCPPGFVPVPGGGCEE